MKWRTTEQDCFRTLSCQHRYLDLTGPWISWKIIENLKDICKNNWDLESVIRFDEEGGILVRRRDTQLIMPMAINWTGDCVKNRWLSVDQPRRQHKNSDLETGVVAVQDDGERWWSQNGDDGDHIRMVMMVIIAVQRIFRRRVLPICEDRHSNAF